MKTVRLVRKNTVRQKSGQSPLTDAEAVLQSSRALSSTSRISTEDMFDWLSRANAPVLQIVIPGEQPRILPLSSEEVTIGRDEQNKIHLPFPNVSRHHARVARVGEEYRIEDLNSTNGTYVNGIRISRCVLRDNDQIRVGATRIIFTRHSITGAKQ